MKTKKKLKKIKGIGFLSNAGPDPSKNHKATKPAFNAGQSSARQQNASEMTVRWRADDGPLIVVFESYSPPSTKTKQKRCQSGTHSEKCSGTAYAVYER